jgi:putative tryptophan/tyrosine transport system substrate-binding protein
MARTHLIGRRSFIKLSTLASIGWPSILAAQQVKKVYRLGYLALGGQKNPWFDGMIDGLRQLGYVEGANLHIEWRLAAGKRELLADMANDLVRLNVDIIVASGSAVASIVKRTITNIPIVAIATHDGVGAGLYDSLKKPGKNITGVESLAPELDGKRVQFFREIVPELSRLCVLYNPLDHGALVHPPLILAAAAQSGIEVELVEARSASELGVAFDKVRSLKPGGLLSVADPMTLGERKRIVDFCSEQKIPNAHEIREFVTAGGLLSYGASFYGIWHRSAYFIDKILKGAKPGDLPVELPTVFDLAINVRSAKALGLAIPASLASTADALVE